MKIIYHSILGSGLSALIKDQISNNAVIFCKNKNNIKRSKNFFEFDNIGGVAYLTQLQDSVPSAANLEYYFDIVRERGLLRRMIQTCTQAISDAYEE